MFKKALEAIKAETRSMNVTEIIAMTVLAVIAVNKVDNIITSWKSESPKHTNN